MSHRNLSALALLSLTLAACGSGGGTDPVVPPSTAPTILSVSPSNGATGVAADAKIVVTFSRPMEQVYTQAAYQSTGLPAADLNFTWNTSGTVLTLTPKTPLVYATGTAFNIAAKQYEFKFTGVAKDTSGTALTAMNSVFSTLRDITTTLPTIPSLDAVIYKNEFGVTRVIGEPTIHVGDDVGKTSIRGLLTFDLAGLPDGVGSGMVSATLNLKKQKVLGSPYTALNPCKPTPLNVCASPTVPVNLEHTLFGNSLETVAQVVDAYSKSALHALGAIDKFSLPSASYVEASVLVAVQDDLINRAVRGNRSQYRLSFPLEFNGDSVSDCVVFSSGSVKIDPPYIVAVFQIP